MVAHRRRRRSLDEAAFVLRAVGIEHAVLSSGADYVLVVRPDDALRAAEQLAAYELENNTSAASDQTSHQTEWGKAWPGAVAYVVLLLVFYRAQHTGLGGLDWTAAGRSDAELVTAGAWWRCVTALCLHADLAHLAGNLLFGVIFGVFVSQLLGNGLGWLLILLGGALGNGSNAVIQLAEHRSLGASTAVFAALGMLVACSYRQAHTERRSRILRWAPLAAGLALFGLLGVEGQHTDVMAHISGVLWGGLIGLLVARGVSSWPASRASQLLAGSATLLILGSAWCAAIATALSRTR